MEFSQNIKKMRQNSSYSQKQLGALLGLSQQYFSQLEKKLIEPNIELLIKIADVFGCSVDYLLGRENEAGIIEISGDRVIPEKSQIQKLYEKLNTRNQLRLICYGQGLFDGQ
ncbi:MAG: helix-turn-helix transcriptional regulator [Clostridia bacterium]